MTKVIDIGPQNPHICCAFLASILSALQSCLCRALNLVSPTKIPNPIGEIKTKLKSYFEDK